MPTLKTPSEEIKQFFLPSTSKLPQEDQAWVKMDVGEMLAGDVLDMMKGGDITAGNTSGEMLVNRIKEWNFTEDDGTAIPITLASVRRMETKDLTYLFGHFNTGNTGLDTEQKKT